MYLILLTRGEGWYLYNTYPVNKKQKNAIIKAVEKNKQYLNYKIVEI